MESGQHWSRLSKAPLPSTAALLEVFRSAEAYLNRGNIAGCVLQLVRVTAAAAEEPLKFGMGHGGESRFPAAPGSLYFASLGIAEPGIRVWTAEGSYPAGSVECRGGCR